MAGRMGGEQVTTQNLTVIEADPARNLLLVKGTVPGAANGLLLIKKAIKSKKK
jgi:large subunit ribosomal protein L3